MIPRRLRSVLLPLLLAITGCDVRSVVGYNDVATGLGPGPTCATGAPIAACEISPCVVKDLFPAHLGAESIAVDGEFAFFLSAPNVLAKRPFDGGPLVELVSNLDQMQRFAIDETNVYWTELDSVIKAVPKAGGEVFTVASPFGNLVSIAVSADHVYAASSDRNKIVMVPKSPSGETPGGGTELPNQADPQEIALDATHVYWINRGATGVGDGQLMRAVLGDLTSAEMMLSNLDAPVRLAVSSDSIYVASLDTISLVPKTGGAAKAIATGFDKVRGMAPFGETLYVAAQGGLSRLPAAGGAVTILDARPISAMKLGCTGVYGAAWYEDALVRYGR